MLRSSRISACFAFSPVSSTSSAPAASRAPPTASAWARVSSSSLPSRMTIREAAPPRAGQVFFSRRSAQRTTECSTNSTAQGMIPRPIMGGTAPMAFPTSGNGARRVCTEPTGGRRPKVTWVTTPRVPSEPIIRSSRS